MFQVLMWLWLFFLFFVFFNDLQFYLFFGQKTSRKNDKVKLFTTGSKLMK